MTGTNDTKFTKALKKCGGHPFKIVFSVFTIMTVLLGSASHLCGEQLGTATYPPAELSAVNTFLQTPSPAENENLILVNPWNEMPSDYEVQLVQLPNGQFVDNTCYADLMKMIADCENAGLSPIICSTYRTHEKQTALYENKVKRLIKQGLSRETAKTEAAKSVAVPGTSEHQLGLAVDITDKSNQKLDRSQEKTKVQQWLMQNCWKYGFILRYPDGKSNITGIIYEPWHYRYVGKTVAKEITEQGITLEEYLDKNELKTNG